MVSLWTALVLKHDNRLEYVGLTSEAGQRLIRYLRKIKASKMPLTIITAYRYRITNQSMPQFFPFRYVHRTAKRQNELSCLSACLSVRMELGTL